MNEQGPANTPLSPTLPNWQFPLSESGCPGIPPHYHPGGFAFRRRHDVHTGVDLYCKPGAEVFAVEDGVVIDRGLFTGPALGHGWWEETRYVTVQGDSGQVVYGEISTDLKINDVVRRGDLIGLVVPVLPPEKLRADVPGHSVAMLHFEWLLPPEGHEEIIKPFSVSLHQPTPTLLADPTAALLSAAKSLSSLPEWTGRLVPEPPAEQPATPAQIASVFTEGRSVRFHEDTGEMTEIDFSKWTFVSTAEPENPDFPASYFLHFPDIAQATWRPSQPDYLRVPDALGITRKFVMPR